MGEVINSDVADTYFDVIVYKIGSSILKQLKILKRSSKIFPKIQMGKYSIYQFY